MVLGRIRQEIHSYKRTKINEEGEYIGFRRHEKREMLMGLSVPAVP